MTEIQESGNQCFKIMSSSFSLAYSSIVDVSKYLSDLIN